MLVEKAYKIIGGYTPIPADCGRLCNRACCKGGENDGMMLFPGEEKLLHGNADFRIEEREIDATAVFFAVCEGHCNREERPLSCRIYPFVLRGERLSLDSRAKYRCPLCASEAQRYVSQRFLRRVRRALMLLAGRHSEFFRKWQKALAEYDKFLS